MWHFLVTEKVQEVKKNFLQESGMQFSELEEKVLQFHLSNLEFACGSTLDQVWKLNLKRAFQIYFVVIFYEFNRKVRLGVYYDENCNFPHRKLFTL